MTELRGKGWCVLGYFVWMLGAGLVLDSDWFASAGVLLSIGAGLVALGVWQSRWSAVKDEGRSR